jgi:hypothetical protein
MFDVGDDAFWCNHELSVRSWRILKVTKLRQVLDHAAAAGRVFPDFPGSPGWMQQQRQCRCGCGRWYRPALRSNARILDMCTPVFLITILSISSRALNLSQYSNPPPLVHTSTTIFSTQTGNSASLQPRHPSMSGSQASSPVDHRRLASAHPRIKL